MTSFLALPVSAGAWLEALARPPAALGLVHPADLHLTIAFFGDAEREAAMAGFRAFRWAQGAVPVTLGAVVPMGARARPSAYAALLGEGRAEVEAAMAATRDRCCDAAGARRETRPPLAHVTLARPRRGALARADDRAEAARWASGLELGAVALCLERVALYTSAEPGQRPRYVRVAERRLAELTDERTDELA